MREKAIKIKRKRCASDWFLDIFKVVFLVLVTVICVYPFWNIFVVSINDATDALRGGLYFLPRKLSLASYKDILGRATFLHGILITVLRTAIGTPLAVLVTTALAYVLSRKELLFRKQLNLFFIFTMYFGGGMVPYYMVLKSLGMLNNFIVQADYYDHCTVCCNYTLEFLVRCIFVYECTVFKNNAVHFG